MKYLLITVVFLLGFNLCFSQTEKQPGDSLVVFYFPNGKPSSDGTLRNGKPDGYWRSYFESGRIKSEGNRKNFLLDGPWKFYDDNGKLRTVIHYSEGKKAGLRIAYDENEALISEENFSDDIQQDTTRIYYLNGAIQSITLFEKGKKEGRAVTYDSLGKVHELNDFRQGALLRKQFVNRSDNHGKRTGLWVELHNDFSIREEIPYERGMKNGYRKVYDRMGNLTKVEKYVDDILQNDPEELKAAEIRKTYYSDARIKQSGAYLNGLPVGIHILYKPDGTVEKAEEYENGILVSKGKLDSLGRKTMEWIYFYPDGLEKSRGIYSAGLKEGKWQFFHPNKEIEQVGTYVNDKPTGEWKWFYDNGRLHRKDIYRNGKEDGLSIEYNLNGDTVSIGEYENGEREGIWEFKTGNLGAKGAFTEGLMQGEWIHTLEGGIVVYRGYFNSGIPVNKHRAYYADGKLKWEGKLEAGKRQGDWRLYGKEGELFLTIYYQDGIEVKYDGIKIRPEFERYMFENLLDFNPFIF